MDAEICVLCVVRQALGRSCTVNDKLAECVASDQDVENQPDGRVQSKFRVARILKVEDSGCCKEHGAYDLEQSGEVDDRKVGR